MTRIVSYPFDLGNGPTKSMAMSENRSRGIGSECRNPAGSWFVALLRRQLEHELTYVFTVLDSPGQKHLADNDSQVFFMPKWFSLS
jgi:hypothetical protein